MKFRWIDLLILTVVPHAGATTLDSYMRNREATAKFEEKSYNAAYKGYVGALEDDPLNAAVQLNIARTLEAGEDYEKAEKAYLSALQLLPENSQPRYQALFNLGNVRAKLKRIPDALEAYQAALAINEESKEVKTNIELLWQGGGGGGEGDQESQDQNDQKGQGKNDKPQEGPEKPQKQKFQSKELTPDDVKKILDEIKNQEQNIRAQENDKGQKTGTRGGKDW